MTMIYRLHVSTIAIAMMTDVDAAMAITALSTAATSHSQRLNATSATCLLYRKWATPTAPSSRLSDQ
jgi:hypothetical protein